jgi:hypothetical protein
MLVSLGEEGEKFVRSHKVTDAHMDFEVMACEGGGQWPPSGIFGNARHKYRGFCYSSWPSGEPCL